MKIVVLKETTETEKRVSLTPEIVQKLAENGSSVLVEKGAGIAAGFEDSAYEAAGATLFKERKTLFQMPNEPTEVASKKSAAKSERKETEKPSKKATSSPAFLPPFVIIGVSPPAPAQIKLFPEHSVWIGLLKPYQSNDSIEAFRRHKITAFALELVPRISRAQSMDVLSSQSNLAGYRAVIEASFVYNRAFPLMMTAAGTIPPAKVLILGAGVAGLQAIATAKRLGAVVSAFDVRAAAKEQVESLGAHFVEVEAASTNGEDEKGYAKEMDKAYQKRQGAKLKEVIQTQDIVITTALIPGKPAPKLITIEMLKFMKKGSLVVDMAVEWGGNCEGAEPEQLIEKHGVTIIGYTNLPSRIPQDASRVFARNSHQFLKICFAEDETLNLEDEITEATVLTHQGEILQRQFKKVATKA